MSPEDYDAWYRTPRGAWAGETEFALLKSLLDPAPGETLLDVGCGAGYFTRRFAAQGVAATGLDPDPGMLAFARSRATAGETYLRGDARSLPFSEGSFDLCVSVTALCFVREELAAMAEMLRVTRRRFALGLLNRRSLLYLQKGRHGGKGAYRGAHWHSAGELRKLLARLSIRDPVMRYAVFLPGGGPASRLIECAAPKFLPWGAFIAVTGGGDLPESW